MSVCVCMCLYVSVCVCMCLYVSVCVCMCLYFSGHNCVLLSMYGCVYTCMDVSVHAWMSMNMSYTPATRMLGTPKRVSQCPPPNVHIDCIIDTLPYVNPSPFSKPPNWLEMYYTSPYCALTNLIHSYQKHMAG